MANQQNEIPTEFAGMLPGRTVRLKNGVRMIVAEGPRLVGPVWRIRTVDDKWRLCKKVALLPLVLSNPADRIEALEAENAKLKRQHGGVQAAARRAQQQGAAALDRVVELDAEVERLTRERDLMAGKAEQAAFMRDQVIETREQILKELGEGAAPDTLTAQQHLKIVALEMSLHDQAGRGAGYMLMNEALTAENMRLRQTELEQLQLLAEAREIISSLHLCRTNIRTQLRKDIEDRTTFRMLLEQEKQGDRLMLHQRQWMAERLPGIFALIGEIEAIAGADNG